MGGTVLTQMSAEHLPNLPPSALNKHPDRPQLAPNFLLSAGEPGCDCCDSDVVMSTHIHLVYYDPFCNRVEFSEGFFAAVSRIIKKRYNGDAPTFDQGRNKVVLHGYGAIADKIAYCQANPTEAGAVRYSIDWPGAISRIDDMGRRDRAIITKRDNKYFDPNSYEDEEIELRVELPECLVTAPMPNCKSNKLFGEEGARDYIRQLTHQYEREAWAKKREEGKTFMGPEACRKASHQNRSILKKGKYELNPQFATKGGGKELFEKVVAELKAFRQAYAEAMDRWRKGDRDVEFPFGTYKMRVHHRARCASG